ncbi:MAG: hypothetical protein K6E57_00655 [Fibrobacter sp.]|nr:hypothetical protein [Fibrobacter sp.]
MNKSGYILAMLMGILLVLALMLSAFLHTVGGLRRYVSRVGAEVQAVYNAESAILLRLWRLPGEAFKDLPPVSISPMGPYEEFCTPVVLRQPGVRVSQKYYCASVVSRYQKLHYSAFHNGIQAERETLKKRILGSSRLKRFSGSKRFFSPPSEDYIQIIDGDLRLDFDDHLASANFYVTGDATVMGAAVFDTLRLYALGNVFMRGQVQARFLEVVAGERIEVSNHVRFRGLLTAQREVVLEDHATGDFPSATIALGQNEPRVALLQKARFAGLLAAPAGTLELDSTARHDSVQSIMPAFYGGERFVFERVVRQ